jgi:hypothetical protein
MGGFSVSVLKTSLYYLKTGGVRRPCRERQLHEDGQHLLTPSQVEIESKSLMQFILF